MTGGRKYSVFGSVTNTESATLPLMTLISTTNVRPKIYDINIGSGDAPVDQTARYQLQRCTTTGTAGSSFTPVALDPSDPAAVSTCGLAVFGAGPTLTASSFLLMIGGAMRSQLRWACKDGGEIVLPATASNGVALMAIDVSTAWATGINMHFAE